MKNFIRFFRFEFCGIRHSLKNFPLNLWKFRKFLWNYHPWDYSNFYEVTAIILKDQHRLFSEHGMSKHSDHSLRKIQTAYVLADRLHKGEVYYDFLPDEPFTPLTDSDSYIKRAFEQVDKFKRDFIKCDQRLEADKKLFFKLLDRHLHTWWD